MLFLRLLALVIGFLGFAYGQQLFLPDDELETLRIIGRTLGKHDWNFNEYACSGPSSERQNGNFLDVLEATVVNGSCHVTRILLKGQNLNGTLPPELVQLPFLLEIDLTRNYLNGSIPRRWGSSLTLESISLLGNRITGQLPMELADITTLKSLALDFNELSGHIPREFGKFPQIERLLLTSNYLTGDLPESLSNLSTLREFRISDNNFTGSIPDFIGKWTNITDLRIQASGHSGPIPSSIASLNKLEDLRISDLTGNNESDPGFLSNLNISKIMILRNCNIVGEFPKDIDKLRGLDVLDLSFNKLTGQLPPSFPSLYQTEYIYLTGNSLTGPLPDGEYRGQIDLSYNSNITFGSSDCQQAHRNYFHSSNETTSRGTVACLERCDQAAIRRCALDKPTLSCNSPQTTRER